MQEEKHDNQHELAEFDHGEQIIDRLMEEINILRLEGRLFDFNPKRRKIKTKALQFTDVNKRPVTIEPNPAYGMPGVLAYRVLQAVFLKMTEEGYPYPGTVSFSMRELSRIAGRTSWGSETGRELYHAIRQLRTTNVHCSFYNKDTNEWEVGEFNVFSMTMFSGKRSQVNYGSITIHPFIERSVNRRHVSFFNLHRLSTLDVIGMVMYKRLFFHFANIYNPGIAHREDLSFCKDYEAICREWLGGLKPERYKSKIVSNQLGRHLDGLRQTRLIRKCEIEKKADGSGFKLTFYPGRGFFDDYEAYYLERQQPRLRFKQTADLLDIQQPIEVVAYFHELLDHEHNTFDEKETAYATQLLKAHSLAEVRDLVEYTVEAAHETNFRMQKFGAVSQYRDRWESDRKRRQAYQRKQEATRACPYCNEHGMLTVRTPTGAIGVHHCPHDIEQITRLEDSQQLRRV